MPTVTMALDTSRVLRLWVLGVPVAVTVSGPGSDSLTENAVRAWSRCEADDPAVPVQEIRVVLDPDIEGVLFDGPSIRGGDEEAILDALSSLITMTAIQERQASLLMFHACALADLATGRTVVLVGPSGRGKTSLAKALGRRFGYLSDETVGIDESHAIVAYPKPLSLVIAGSAHKEQVGADDLGLVLPPASCVLHRLVLIERDGSAEPWLESMSTVDALAALAPHTSYLATLPRPLHRLADAIDSAGGVSVLHYSEATRLEQTIESLLA